MDVGALEVHGITNEFLNKQPRFEQVVDELLEFIDGAELVIHNAAFDVAFLNAELARLSSRRIVDELCRVFDTLPLARRMHPGQRNSLDALCKRYGVDNSRREYHGALLDAHLLLDVYLAMTGGQTALVLGEATVEAAVATLAAVQIKRPEAPLCIVLAHELELAAHERLLAAIDKSSGGKTLWHHI